MTFVRLGALATAGLAAGCMVVPRTTSTYNAECRVVEKRITLEAQQVGPIGACRHSAECAGLLGFYGIVAATSAVVSGSIAVVGNVAYWLERQGQCQREEPPAPRAVPGAAPAPAPAPSGPAAAS